VDPVEPAPAPPTVLKPWTPKLDLVLRHKTIQQTIEITGSMVLEGLPTFWQVRLHGAYGDPKPWMIVETALKEQYEIREGR